MFFGTNEPTHKKYLFDFSQNFNTKQLTKTVEDSKLSTPSFLQTVACCSYSILLCKILSFPET